VPTIIEEAEFWQHIYKTQQAGIVIHANGIIRNINLTGVKMLGGASALDFIGKPVVELIISPAYREIVYTRIRQLQDGAASAPPQEMRVVRLDGTELDVLVSATSLIKNGEIIIETMLIDISMLKERERLLEAVLAVARIPNEDAFLSDAQLVMRQLLEAMQRLYIERHLLWIYKLWLHRKMAF